MFRAELSLSAGRGFFGEKGIEFTEIVERVDAGGVAVGEIDAKGVIADEFSTGGGDGAVVGGLDDGEHGAAEKVAFSPAAGAGAVLAEEPQRQDGVVTVGPGDFEGFGFLQVEVGGGGLVAHGLSVLV
jgi:hypothetical protein